MQRTTFITGASGLLGAELVSQFLSEEPDRRLVCLLRDTIPSSRFFTEKMNERVITVQGDIRDESLITRILNEYDVSSVFHLAAQTLVEPATRLPGETLDVNVRGTWSILEASRRHEKKVKAVLVASSDKAYGNLSGEKYDESHPLMGSYPYDVSKSCADLITQSYAKSYGLNTVITRCGNFFGPGDVNLSRLFPSTIVALLKGIAPVIRSDGKYIRDYLFIADAAAAYRELETYALENKCAGEAFNFSYGLRKSVLDIVNLIRKTMGSSIEPVIENRVTNEIPVQTLDSSKARKKLGWKPKIGFEEGIKHTIAWYRAQHEKELSLKPKVVRAA